MALMSSAAQTYKDNLRHGFRTLRWKEQQFAYVGM